LDFHILELGRKSFIIRWVFSELGSGVIQSAFCKSKAGPSTGSGHQISLSRNLVEAAGVEPRI